MEEIFRLPHYSFPIFLHYLVRPPLKAVKKMHNTIFFGRAANRILNYLAQKVISFHANPDRATRVRDPGGQVMRKQNLNVKSNLSSKLLPTEHFPETIFSLSFPTDLLYFKTSSSAWLNLPEMVLCEKIPFQQKVVLRPPKCAHG